MDQYRGENGRFAVKEDTRPLSGMILFRTDNPTASAIRSYARDNDTSMSALLRRIVDKWLRQVSRKPGVGVF